MFGPAVPCSINTDPGSVVAGQPIPDIPQEHILPVLHAHDETATGQESTDIPPTYSADESLPMQPTSYLNNASTDPLTTVAIADIDEERRKRRYTVTSETYVDFADELTIKDLFRKRATRMEMWWQLKLALPVVPFMSPLSFRMHSILII